MSLNDTYMIALMTGWMFFLMGIYMRVFEYFVFGGVVLVVSYILVRTQAFVGDQQFVKGMIPHHSMAVHMSKRLLKKHKAQEAAGRDPRSPQAQLATLVNNIVRTQEAEITMLKQLELALELGV